MDARFKVRAVHPHQKLWGVLPLHPPPPWNLLRVTLHAQRSSVCQRFCTTCLDLLIILGGGGERHCKGYVFFHKNVVQTLVTQSPLTAHPTGADPENSKRGGRVPPTPYPPSRMKTSVFGTCTIQQCERIRDAK